MSQRHAPPKPSPPDGYIPPPAQDMKPVLRQLRSQKGRMSAMARGMGGLLANGPARIPEVITSDSVGLLAPHEDDETLAGHLLGLLRDPERARRIAVGGRALVEGEFSARAFGENIAALYADALRGRGDGKR